MEMQIRLSPLRILVLVFTAQLLTACVPGETLFSSGIAKEWGGDQPISREQLIMEPLYYLSHLDEDLDHTTWLLIPQGRLMHSARICHELSAMSDLLGTYLDTLEQLPDGRQLPEYELASIYIEMLGDFSGYLQNKKSLQDIEAKRHQREPRIRQLELALENAAGRRLNTLVQTLSSNSGI